MFFIELFFNFVFAGIAIVSWERIRQGKNHAALFQHLKVVYVHLFITLLFTVSTMFIFDIVLNASENEVGVATLTAGGCSWFLVGHYLKRLKS